MKAGANFTDRNNIRDYVKAGQTNVSVIADRLKIDPKVVRNFVNAELKAQLPISIEGEDEDGSEDDDTDE